MALPMHLRVEAMPDDPRMQAFLYGPVVLAGDLGSNGLTREMIIGPMGPEVAANMEIPSFKAVATDPAAWIKPDGKLLAFHTTGQARDVSLMPLNKLVDKRYSIYWQVS
jgi:DUF1680 family protein